MRSAVAIGLGLLLPAVAGAAESWDMPMAYPDSNFHTATGKAFAECVGKESGGELQITVHGNGSLSEAWPASSPLVFSSSFSEYISTRSRCDLRP